MRKYREYDDSIATNYITPNSTWTSCTSRKIVVSIGDSYLTPITKPFFHTSSSNSGPFKDHSLPTLYANSECLFATSIMPKKLSNSSLTTGCLMATAKQKENNYTKPSRTNRSDDEPNYRKSVEVDKPRYTEPEIRHNPLTPNIPSGVST